MSALEAKQKELISKLQTDMSSQIIKKYSTIIENHKTEFAATLAEERRRVETKHQDQRQIILSKCEESMKEMAHKCREQVILIRRDSDRANAALKNLLEERAD